MGREAMEAAVAAFLEAAGADLSDPQLAETPRRVAEAWAEELLAGQGVEAATLLEGFAPPAGEGAVVVTGLRYVGVCPHHLLPYQGTAHLAYLPGERAVGFSKLARLVQTLGARLVLQEQLAQDLCGALSGPLGAQGAAAVLEGSHACMTLRGVRQAEATVTCTAYSGAYAGADSPHRRALDDAIRAWRSTHP